MLAGYLVSFDIYDSSPILEDVSIIALQYPFLFCINVFVQTMHLDLDPLYGISALMIFSEKIQGCLEFLEELAFDKPYSDVWACSGSNYSNKSRVVCNPLARQYKLLLQLGSAWSCHGAVLVDSVNLVMVLTELAALYLSNGATTKNAWHTFSTYLPSKPRSPDMVWESVFALCYFGSPWRPQWKLFTCKTDPYCLNSQNNWLCLGQQEWSHIFDIIKRQRLVRRNGGTRGLKCTYSLDPSCSAIMILRLDLERTEWEEARRMYRCFQESSKLKVFVLFSILVSVEEFLSIVYQLQAIVRIRPVNSRYDAVPAV
ncbi:SKP1-interacting partner 15 [Turnera subulata]|uniref:SKP1-interacting partner 15 n=1 Tax=Turnera subulata TaxID=218843 RepID=A0A9Q0GIF5_9ROSI|nr:SKP1-interacting partner 15 [Turnera subulata]